MSVLLIIQDDVQCPLQHGLGVEHDQGRHPVVLVLHALTLEDDPLRISLTNLECVPKIFKF